MNLMTSTPAAASWRTTFWHSLDAGADGGAEVRIVHRLRKLGREAGCGIGMAADDRQRRRRKP